MRQPKYEMGAQVTAEMPLRHVITDTERMVRLCGIVVGVSYTPENSGGTGADGPFYRYDVLFDGAERRALVQEDVLALTLPEEGEKGGHDE